MVKARRSRRKECDDELGWILVLVYSHDVLVKWYKTFAGAEKTKKEFDDMKVRAPWSRKRAFIVQTSEVERWHKSTGVDELERLLAL